MIQQSPATPTPPLAGQSQLSAQDRADIAQSVRDAQATAREAQQIAAQAHRQAGAAAAMGVLKDPGGRVIVTGPDGRQVIIDPKAGLDGDQLQEVVQQTLQPARPERADHGPPVVPVVAIVFTFLFLIVVVISRAITARRVPSGPVTAALPAEAAARLARIEQAVEAVAIEVERISEAQRYSAQLLTDRLPGASTTAPAIAAARADHG